MCAADDDGPGDAIPDGSVRTGDGSPFIHASESSQIAFVVSGASTFPNGDVEAGLEGSWAQLGSSGSEGAKN